MDDILEVEIRTLAKHKQRVLDNALTAGLFLITEIEQADMAELDGWVGPSGPGSVFHFICCDGGT